MVFDSFLSIQQAIPVVLAKGFRCYGRLASATTDMCSHVACNNRCGCSMTKSGPKLPGVENCSEERYVDIVVVSIERADGMLQRFEEEEKSGIRCHSQDIWV